MHWAHVRPGRLVLVAALIASTILAAVEAPTASSSTLAVGPEGTTASRADPRLSITVSATARSSPRKRAFIRRMAWERVPAGFVARRGTELVLDGQPFVFTGMNIYNANSTGDCWHSMAGSGGLKRALKDIGPGQEVFRAWFFQPFATRRGKRDWRDFDRTLRLARARGQKVIVTLTDHWGACERRSPRTSSFYASGYRKQVDPGAIRTYRRYVAEVVKRYRDDPTILMWQLVNEAETKRANGTCAPASVLRDFAADMSALIKRIDPHHLVSLGTIGGTQCGMRGSGYRSIHAVPGIDVCEVHDYSAPSVAMPRDHGYGIQRRIDECTALGKPIFVGEVGFPPPGGNIARRAAWLGRKFAAQFEAGVSGILIWGWRNGSHGGSARHDFDVGPGDPALRLLRRY